MEGRPKLIRFQKIGSAEEGFLSISEGDEVMGFMVKRVFWTYGTPASVTRGRHAHYATEMVLIAVHGNIQIETEMVGGQRATFSLNDPNVGLYMPALCWHEMHYSHDAVQLVLCSTNYDEGDYIRSRSVFENQAR